MRKVVLRHCTSFNSVSEVLGLESPFKPILVVSNLALTPDTDSFHWPELALPPSAVDATLKASCQYR